MRFGFQIRHAFAISLIVTLGVSFAAAGTVWDKKKKPGPASTSLDDYIQRVHTAGLEQPASTGSLWVSSGSLSNVAADYKAHMAGDLVVVQLVDTFSAATSGENKTSRQFNTQSAITGILGNVSPNNALQNLLAANSNTALDGKGASTMSSNLHGRARTSRACAQISRQRRADHRQLFRDAELGVYSDGSFVYVPEGVRCPMELSTYFRINEKNTGQFERTLIIADKGAYVSYLEGCTAPMRDENQLHAAVVELVALDDAEIKYSTVQNWYPGDKEGKGGIYNFVTKRGDCRGRNSKISWTQVETGSAITWKYPSCILRGDGSRGEFYSIAISNGYQQVDSGTKMVHLGKNTSSRIISKGIAAGRSDNTYRGLVSAHRRATNARNFTQCDSLLIGDQCGAHTVPYIEAKNASAQFEHEATTSKISDDQLFYCLQRGLSEEEAVALIVNGFVRDVLQQLPMEFLAETQKLISISLEGSVG